MQQSIRPNTKKIFILNLLKLTIALIGMVAALLFFNSFVGLDVFAVVFEQFGMEIDINSLIFYIVGIFAIGYFSLLAFNYFQLKSIVYEFLPDKLACRTVAFFVVLNSKEIPYRNIARISFENGPLNTGNIILDLSAMNEKTFEIKFVDNPQQVAQYVQNMVHSYTAMSYNQQVEDNKIGNIMDNL